MSNATTTPRASSTRLLSLDVFRGLALVGMVLVNVPGANVWPQLSHAAWDSMTFADVVFPAFLFAMGASMALGHPPTALRTFRRVVVLVAVGLALNYAATGSPLRYPGVLQRIAFAFLLASMIIRLPRKIVVAIVVVLLVAHGAALVRYGTAPGHSLESTLDLEVFGRPHLYLGMTYDPEGVVSSVASLATVLIGFLAGGWLRRAPRTPATVAWLLGGSLVVALLAWPTQSVADLNKQLWTPSYTMLTAALCGMVLAVVYLVCDVGSRRARALGVPFAIIGANSLVVYAGSELAAIGLFKIVTPSGPCAPDGCPTTTGYAWLFDHLFVPWAGLRLGSLLFSLAFVGVFWVLAALLWRAKIFVRA